MADTIQEMMQASPIDWSQLSPGFASAPVEPTEEPDSPKDTAHVTWVQMFKTKTPTE